MNYPNCPTCQSEHTYHDTIQFICPDCGYEWNEGEESEAIEQLVVVDVNGNSLNNGDTVILVKDLKLKGTSEVLKKGTKYKNIRIVEGDHNVDCGKFLLKSEFLKKA